MESVSEVIGKIVIVLLTIAGLALLGGWIVSWSWNYTMPHIFGWPTITYWQGFALSVLFSFLVKSNSTK